MHSCCKAPCSSYGLAKRGPAHGYLAAMFVYLFSNRHTGDNTCTVGWRLGKRVICTAHKHALV